MEDASMALTIYGIPRSRAIRTLWMAHELGVPYELVEVAPGAEGSRRAEFLAINPNGHVPFIDDDGLVLWESLAINLHLARKHGGDLAPGSLAEESLAVMWTVWAATELEPPASQAMYHTFMLPESDRVPGLKMAALQQVEGPLLVLEQALAKGEGFVMGGRFTVADLNLACCVFYLRMNPEVLQDKPAVREWYAAALARPGARAAFALRGE
jgi:glutathione S-transferase